jgi:hypothetical protein
MLTPVNDLSDDHRRRVMLNARNFFSVITLAMFTVAALAAEPVNIVKNPGFDAIGADWDVHMAVSNAFGGSEFYAYTGCIGEGCVGTPGTGAFIRQLLPTFAGEQYELSFVFRALGASQYSVFWDGAPIDLRSIDHDSGFVPVSYEKLTASSNGTFLEIHGRSDPGFILFDNFAVVQATAALNPVPEPLTSSMLLGGLAVFGLRRRRR